jgi:rod shape-determining protein MreC
MESFLGRYRNLIILVGVLFLQVLGLAVQVKTGANEDKDTRLIRMWALGAITPFERALVWVQNSTGNVWHNYFYLRGVRAENRQLKEQIEQMRVEQVRLTEDAAQARRLQTLLAFKEQFISKTVAAQVIGTSGSDLSRIVTLDKGENAGIRRDMAVITADGIVGKVLLVSPNLAQVLLISDQSSGVGAILDKSRLQGVLRGTANGEVALERVMSDEQVQPGETVLTSGGDQIFPKGLPVGTVTRVGKGKDLFLSINIKPAANLSRLEEVLVLTEKQERESVAEDHVRVRAADILAQRLPSVPDKPATVGTPAGVAQGASEASAGANTATKPAGAPGTNAAGSGKSASGNPAKSTTVPVPQGKTAVQTSVAQKPKPVNKPSTEPKPDGAPGLPATQPSIVEQKPAPVPAQPDTPPPAPDNSPQ